MEPPFSFRGQGPRVDERVRSLLRKHGLPPTERTIGFPYLTEAYILRRRAAAARGPY